MAGLPYLIRQPRHIVSIPGQDLKMECIVNSSP